MSTPRALPYGNWYPPFLWRPGPRVSRVWSAWAVALTAVAALPGGALAGQQARAGGPQEAGTRQVTVALGFGNAFATVGGAVEYYLVGDRVSVFGGIGYTPEIDPGDPSGLTGVAGVRAYTPGANHRAFAELSVSQLNTEFGTDERHYGPGLQLGYQFTDDGGFTALVATGAGLELADGGAEPRGMLSFGLGYTWRSARGADVASEEPGPRRWTALGGMGNALGWVGGQVEYYLAGDRLSVFGGFGHTPPEERGYPSGPTGAAGVRAYTAGSKHRALAELSLSQVSTTPATDERNYGPGLQLGYQFTADQGFTVLASWGAGLEFSDGDVTRWRLLNLGFGYTWR